METGEDSVARLRRLCACADVLAAEVPHILDVLEQAERRWRDERRRRIAVEQDRARIQMRLNHEIRLNTDQQIAHTIEREREAVEYYDQRRLLALSLWFFLAWMNNEQNGPQQGELAAALAETGLILPDYRSATDKGMALLSTLHGRVPCWTRGVRTAGGTSPAEAEGPSRSAGDLAVRG